MATTDEMKAWENPDWLGRAIEQDDLPWGEALVTTMPEFLARYSLHDSTWRGLFLRAGGVGVATVQWDTHWSRERVPLIDAEAEEHGWPFLFIRLTVHQVTAGAKKRSDRNPNDIIMKATCDTEGVKKTNAGVHATELVCLSSETKITHDAGVLILCLNSDRQTLQLASD